MESGTRRSGSKPWRCLGPLIDCDCIALVLGRRMTAPRERSLNGERSEGGDDDGDGDNDGAIDKPEDDGGSLVTWLLRVHSASPDRPYLALWLQVDRQH